MGNQSKLVVREDGSVELPCRGKRGGSALIDAADYGDLSRFYVYMDKRGYAYVRQYVHTIVAGPAPEGKWVDHINGNPSDNRRCNLRFATPGQNHANRKNPPCNNKSGHVGVGMHGKSKKWRATIQRNGRLHHIGLYDTISSAVRVRRIAEMLLDGEFAPNRIKP